MSINVAKLLTAKFRGVGAKCAKIFFAFFVASLAPSAVKCFFSAVEHLWSWTI